METAPTTTSNSGWSNTLDKLITTGAGVFGSYTNAQVAKANAKLGTAQTAVTTQQVQSNSNVMKYVLIGGGALVAIGLLIFLAKRK